MAATWGLFRNQRLEKTGPELRKLVLSLQPMQISPIIHTEDGYRILKMISREPAGQRELGDPQGAADDSGNPADAQRSTAAVGVLRDRAE